MDIQPSSNNDVLSKEETPTLDALTDKIRAAFPTLTFSDAELILLGEDHAVAVLDHDLIFRFRKSASPQTAISLFERELRLLQELGRRSPVAVPSYEFVVPHAAFGGYRLIPGREMRPNLVEHLTPEQRKAVARQLGSFLAALHALPTNLVGHLPTHEGWNADSFWRYRDRFKERRELYAKYLPEELMLEIDRFYEKFSAMKTPLLTVTHDDLTSDHILIRPDGHSLAGIIDFGDATIGDPAVDFAYLWAYGERFIDDALAAYGSHDPDLRSRSFLHFARYQIDQVHRALRYGEIERAQALIALLPGYLRQTPMSNHVEQ